MFMPVGEEKMDLCKGFGHLDEYQVHLKGRGVGEVWRGYVSQMTGKTPTNRGGDFITLDECGRLSFIGHYKNGCHSERTGYVRDFYPKEQGGGVRRIGYLRRGHPVGHERVYSKEGKLETIINQLKQHTNRGKGGRMRGPGHGQLDKAPMIRMIDYVKFSPVGGFQQIIKSGVYSYSFSKNGNSGPFVSQKGGYYGEWHGNVLEFDKTGLQSLWEYKHGAKSGLEFRWFKKYDQE